MIRSPTMTIRTQARLAVAAALLTAVSTAALAAGEARGFYATAYVQASRLSSTTFDEVGNAGFGAGLRADFGTGVGLGGDIGYRHGNGWATELEWNWRRHGLQSVQRAGSTLSTDGDFASNIIFVNGLRRFAPQGTGWTPYAGAGIGWVQEIDFDINSPGLDRAWSDQGQVALQLIAGGEFPLARDWRLTGDLRLLRVGRVELPAEEGVSGRLSSPRYHPLSVQVGLRRTF
jgi:opacity protein-like surface antigen